MTQKQEKFIIVYMSNGGNASDAYRQAYSTTNMQSQTIYNKAYELLQKDEIRVRLEELNLKIENDNIANIEEVQQFYTKTMRDEIIELKDRLKASELLMKSKGGFTEKTEHTEKVEVIDPFKDNYEN